MKGVTAIAALLCALVGCTFPDLSQSYECETSSDCIKGHMCIEEECTDYYDYTFVLDIHSRGFSSTGQWVEQSGSDRDNGGSYYQCSNCSANTATFSPLFTTEGTYIVSQWWPGGISDGANDVSVTVHHYRGSSDLRVNMSSGGSWAHLGEYEFYYDDEKEYSIVIQGAQKSVVVEALEFVLQREYE